MFSHRLDILCSSLCGLMVFLVLYLSTLIAFKESLPAQTGGVSFAFPIFLNFLIFFSCACMKNFSRVLHSYQWQNNKNKNTSSMEYMP